MNRFSNQGKKSRLILFLKWTYLEYFVTLISLSITSTGIRRYISKSRQVIPQYPFETFVWSDIKILYFCHHTICVQQIRSILGTLFLLKLVEKKWRCRFSDRCCSFCRYCLSGRLTFSCCSGSRHCCFCSWSDICSCNSPSLHYGWHDVRHRVRGHKRLWLSY